MNMGDRIEVEYDNESDGSNSDMQINLDDLDDDDMGNSVDSDMDDYADKFAVSFPFDMFKCFRIQIINRKEDQETWNLAQRK